MEKEKDKKNDNFEKNRTLDIQLIPKLDLLNCSKEELYSLLINRYVSNKWWLLDDDTRKQLAFKNNKMVECSIRKNST